MKIATLGLLTALAVLAGMMPLTTAAQTATTNTNNVIPRFFLTTFSPSVGGGFWIFAGDCPTNLQSISGNPPVYQAGQSFRDSSMIQLGNQYVVVYNDEQSNSACLIISPDMTNWSFYATIFLPDGYTDFWSPKFVTDDSGTIYLTAFVQNTDDSYFYMGVGIMPPDLTELHDFRVFHMPSNPASWQTDPNSSAIYYHGGVYYLFTGDGNEYTSLDILADNWTLLTQHLAYGAGKSVAEWNGLFYLSATELGSVSWSISADLTNWVNVRLPNALSPQLGTIGREGCFFTMMVPGAAASTVRLAIARTSSSTVLSWPAVGRYTLLQSPDLSAGSWTTNTASAIYLNGTNSVTLPTLQTNMFFRLME